MNEFSVRKNIGINLISKYSQIIIQILFSAILARLLSPNDFGIVAILSVFTTFFVFLADMGLGTGIIQNKDLLKKDINHIFICTIYLGFVLAILFALLSFPIASFYKRPVLISLGCLLSISLLFNTMNMIPNALLMREKQFGIIGVRTITISIISNLITIVMAVLGFRYYALVAQSVISSILIFVWNCKSVKLKFHFKFEFNSVKKILGFSMYQFSFNFINYFARNLDNLLTGKIMGEVALGFYDKAYRLMMYPIQCLTYAINPMLHPILSEYQNDKHVIYIKYIKILKVLSLVAVFISIYCYFTSEELITIMFGKQWEKAIPCFRAMSISLWFQLISSSAGAIYQSLGNTKLMFHSGLIHTSITVIFIVTGVMSGDIVTLSIMVSSGLILKFLIESWFLIRIGFGYSLLGFFKKFIPEIFIAMGMIILMLLSKKILLESIFMSFLFKSAICLGSYIIGLLITRQYKYFIELIPNSFKRFKRFKR